MKVEASLGTTRIAMAFFLSGFAALVYQVAWQRLLFVVVGVDIESVTIVVSTFMFGLGVGALLGGILADRFPQCILLAFCLFEAAIAAYGLVSADLLVWSGHLFSGLERPAALIAPGLFAAGDYVQGPYPATLEAAVRSGVAAARLAKG